MADVEQPALGMMQMLMHIATEKRKPEAAPPRNVVELQDALDAVLQVAAVLDEGIESGRIPPARGCHGAAMLMVIRDFLYPCPPGYDATGHDGFTADLVEFVTALRGAREQTGVFG